MAMKTTLLGINSSQFFGSIGVGFLITILGINDTDSSDSKTLMSILKWGGGGFLVLDVIALAISQINIWCCEENTGKKEKIVLPILAATEVVGVVWSLVNICKGNCGIEKCHEGTYKSVLSVLPFILVFLGIKIKNVLTANPIFGGITISGSHGNNASSRDLTPGFARNPKRNYYGFIAVQLIELLRMTAIFGVLTINNEKHARNAAAGVSVGQSVIGSLMGALFLFSFYFFRETMNLKVVGCYNLFAPIFTGLAATLLFTDQKDKTNAPEIAMFLIGLASALEIMRDIFTVDRRYGGQQINIEGEYNDQRGLEIGGCSITICPSITIFPSLFSTRTSRNVDEGRSSIPDEDRVDEEEVKSINTKGVVDEGKQIPRGYESI